MADGLLFFEADDGTAGIELWALVLRDLALTKTVEPAGPVPPGGTITYTLTYSNNGHVPLSGVVISDEVPLELTDLFVDYTPALLPIWGETYAWDVGDLEPGEGGVITISGKNNIVAIGGEDLVTVVNTATISTELNEPDTSNNQASVAIELQVWVPAAGMDVYLPLVVKNKP